MRHETLKSRQAARHAMCRGISRVEVLVIVLCAVVLLAIVAAIVVPQLGGSRRAPQLADGTQLLGIAQSLRVWGRDYDGVLPTPSVVRRQPVDLGSGPQYIPGRGEMDITLDTTANLYSMMVAQNYVTPDLLISPLERNPRVRRMASYNWDAFDPRAGVFWDHAFQADLNRESNVSYAHLLLYGERKSKRWRDLLSGGDDEVGLFSSRGPKDGIGDPNSYTCDRNGNWSGNIVTVGGSVRRLASLQGWEHIFRIDEGIDGGDPVLTFTLAIDREAGPTIQHD